MNFIRRGYYVIRIGKVAKRKLNIKNAKFIDYPFVIYNQMR